jgi:hypothetical protein
MEAGFLAKAAGKRCKRKPQGCSFTQVAVGACACIAASCLPVLLWCTGTATASSSKCFTHTFCHDKPAQLLNVPLTVCKLLHKPLLPPNICCKVRVRCSCKVTITNIHKIGHGDLG